MYLVILYPTYKRGEANTIQLKSRTTESPILQDIRSIGQMVVILYARYKTSAKRIKNTELYETLFKILSVKERLVMMDHTRHC